MNLKVALQDLEIRLTKRRLSKTETQECLGLVREIKRSLSEEEIEMDCVLHKKYEILKNADQKAKEIIERARMRSFDRDEEWVRRKCEEIEMQARSKCEDIVRENKKYLLSLVEESENIVKEQHEKICELKQKLRSDEIR